MKFTHVRCCQSVIGRSWLPDVCMRPIPKIINSSLALLSSVHSVVVPDLESSIVVVPDLESIIRYSVSFPWLPSSYVVYCRTL